MNGDRLLVDTNILVYAYDRSEYAKQRRARALLAWLAEVGLGVLSTQILAEYFSALTRRVTERASAQEARARMERYVRSWVVVNLTPTILLEAARGAVEHGFPYYDAQIWATARVHKIPVVITEDFASSSRVEGVEFVNPFTRSLPGEE